jgi:uncharacterized protein (DUF305 family)
MKRRMPRVLALSAVALSAALVLAACGSDDGMDMGKQPTSPAASPAAPQSAAGFNDTDVMFAQMMIPHHEQAVDMAKVVLAKSANADVKKLATAIEAAQAPEIARMKGWLSAWGKPTAMPGTGGMSGMDHGTGADGMMSDADMRKFRAATGTELDTQFLEMMIVHHNGAIKMAEDELAKGVNADARTLAEAVKTSQSAEVQQMQKLLGGSPNAQPTTSAEPSMPGMTGMPGHGM